MFATGQPFLEFETTADNNNMNMNNMEAEKENDNIIKMRKPVLSIVSEPSNAIHERRLPSATTPYHHNRQQQQRYVVANSSRNNESPSRNQYDDSSPVVVCTKKEHNNPTQYDIENNSNDYYFPDTVDFGMPTTTTITTSTTTTATSYSTPTKPPTKPPSHRTHRKTSSLSSVPLTSVYSTPAARPQPSSIKIRSASPARRQRTSSMSSVDIIEQQQQQQRPSPPRRTASTKSLFRSLSARSLNSSVHSTRSSIQVASHPIDNTMLTYVPVKLPCGVQTYCSPDVLASCPMVLRSLQTDLINIFKLLPWSVHSFIKRTNIWVNATYAYGPSDDPVVLRHSTAHHYEGWLMQVAHDRPEKACSIEIYSCSDFEKMRFHWNGCGLLLHEYCHLIHQFCFGLDNPRINALYEQAQLSGKYDQVLRRDWAGLEEDYDQAYCTVDQKEFFAEMMVAYLANGYHELDGTDCTTMEDCCPILLHSNVTGRVMTKYGFDNSQAAMEPIKNNNPFGWLSLFDKKMMKGQKPKIRMINPIVQESATARSCIDTKHCNKFYPFTRGQLKQYDHDTYVAFQQLYEEIVMWDDPDDGRHNCRFFQKILPSLG